ncbi:hypothetical protein EJB05_55177 [Eragrostis curvula]|uniref:Uncharacterized protein n=1 Tax=Eragrostis curvula TaxID=38414 RepID=A0A5J9SKP1_9POAL|nr:hypothetical protein EJB05_55177 [Eragrostis curvula]
MTLPWLVYSEPHPTESIDLTAGAPQTFLSCKEEDKCKTTNPRAVQTKTESKEDLELATRVSRVKSTKQAKGGEQW